MVCVAPLPSNQKSKIASRKSDGTPRYGLVHLLLHLGSAKNPMFIGLGTGGTPVHPPGYPPCLQLSPCRRAGCQASVRHSIDPNLSELSLVKSSKGKKI